MSENNGNVTIVLSGREFKIRPTWKAIDAIEGDLGVGFVHLLTILVQKSYSLKQLSVIVYYGLLQVEENNSYGASPSLSKVTQMVYDEGLLNPELISSIIQFCEHAVSGGINQEDTEEGKPVATESE